MRLGRVRGWVWGVLAGALLVALALPAGDFWSAWHAPITVQIVMTPDHPTVGQIVHLRVIISDYGRSQPGGTPLHIAADMAAMPMATPQQDVPPVAHSQSYDAQLAFMMAGVWRIDLRMNLPAHEPWGQRLALAVAPGGQADARSP